MGQMKVIRWSYFSFFFLFFCFCWDQHGRRTYCRPPDWFHQSIMLFLFCVVWYPLTGGLSGISWRNFPSRILNMYSCVAEVTEWGRMFHSFPAWTAKEESYRLTVDRGACLLKAGILTFFPSRILSVNCIPMSLGVVSLRIFQTWMIIYLSLLRCRDSSFSVLV